MNVLIISTNRSVHPVPVMPAGACMVAEAAERAGHSVSLLDLMFEPDPFRALRRAFTGATYDAVGVSVRNIDNVSLGDPRFFIAELIPLLDAIRSLTDAPLVLGGAALSIMPEEILRATRVSCAVTGDGEDVFPPLIGKLVRSEPWQDLQGVASLVNGTYRSNAPAFGPASSCPGPDYRRWLDTKAYRAHLSAVPLQTKKGCRFQCVYCTYRRIEGDAYRLSDPECTAEAVLRLATSGLRDIEFVDNVFNAPYDHALAVCESLIRAKPRARFQCVELSPAFLDRRLLSAMERAGFVGIGLTVESASDPVLAGLRKGFSAKEVHAAAEVVRGHRLPCLWIFLLGGPGETQETVKETLRFAERSLRRRDVAYFNVGIRIYPGTELETIARNEGVLPVRQENMLPPLFYVSPGVDADWIMEQIKRSMNDHMNFVSGDSFSFRYLPQISRLGHRLGLRTPLWRYTRFIRRGVRTLGMQV